MWGPEHNDHLRPIPPSTDPSQQPCTPSPVGRMDLFSYLSDDVLLLIFIQLDDPLSLSQTSKRFNRISKESYTRALYFITRYGHQHAMYWALGRGKLVDKQMLDVSTMRPVGCLIRYLVQCAIQYRGHSAPHSFIKKHWSHSLSFESFVYLLNIATDRMGYKELDWSKNADDGSVFRQWLMDKKSLGGRTRIEWEVIRDMFEKYGFIPFCPKDPLVLDFPLALSYEPRLLPLAVKNGLRLDVKYRDFIFRKVFEKPTVSRDGRDETIIKMVEDLQRLDPMQVYVCQVHSLARAALIKTLHSDYPNPTDPKIRHVLLLTVFCSPMAVRPDWSDDALPQILEKLVELGLIQPPVRDGMPEHSKPRSLDLKDIPKSLSREELFNVLLSPFVENERPCIAYARSKAGMGLDEWAITQLKGDVAIHCLPISSKGKLLKRLCEDESIERRVIEAMRNHTIRLENLPEPFSPECATYRAKLGASLPMTGSDMYAFSPLWSHGIEEDQAESQFDLESESHRSIAGAPGDDAHTTIFTSTNYDLGTISQDTLSARLDREESGTRWHRRWVEKKAREPITHITLGGGGLMVDINCQQKSKLNYRTQQVPVMLQIIFSNISRATTELRSYINENVPITLFHIRVLARLGRQPFWNKLDKQKFYFSEEDYLPRESVKPPSSGKMSINTLCNPDPIKSERFQTPTTPSGFEEGSSRPRRMAASATRTYKIPSDSDSDEMSDDMDHSYSTSKRSRARGKGKGKAVEQPPNVQPESTDFHLWTKHLGLLLKEEEKKWKERKRLSEKDGIGKPKERIFKTEFMRALASKVADMRKRDHASTPTPSVEDDSDEEYVQRPRLKRKVRHSGLADRDDRTPIKKLRLSE
ncbi:F-box-like domain-containing protein [Rhizoctonia solani AG-1 IA]|uniref:F-box-like domain-containing protein n=1 Tax=Thanatephorus cucumeris (strain AG1-IA) TaxID=983506 RepID=L8WQH7_THACA|nr:F-box-like domain-containing protein [Rhizoctonia solani AG-1 IA]